MNKRRLSIDRVDELRGEILAKIKRKVDSHPTSVLSLRNSYECYIFEVYVKIQGIRKNGQLVVKEEIPSTLLNSVNLRILPIYDLAEIEDIINPI